MASLLRRASQLQRQKLEVLKLKRKSTREFEKAKFLAKKSTSGLVTIQRKIESSREELGDVSGVLTQRLAQQESILRLVAAAEERLKHEKDAKEQTEQELEFAESVEEKQHAQARIRTISDRIDELIEEIKQRNKMAKKVVLAIEDFQKSKSHLSTKIQKQTHSKPALQKLLKKSKKASIRLAKQIVSKTRQEESTKKGLAKINKKLAELAAKRRKHAVSRPARIKKIKSKIKTKKKKITSKLRPKKKKLRAKIKKTKAKRKTSKRTKKRRAKQKKKLKSHRIKKIKISKKSKNK